MTNCSVCAKNIPTLPEGESIPDPPETTSNITYDPKTGVTVLRSTLVDALCKRCSLFIQPTLRKHLKKEANK
jgi:hypothetical protein